MDHALCAVLCLPWIPLARCSHLQLGFTICSKACGVLHCIRTRRQNDFNKHPAAALIGSAYGASHLFLHVCRTYPSMCAALPESTRLVKCHNPSTAALFQGLWLFPKDCSSFPVKMLLVSPNCGMFGKKRHKTIFRTCRTNPEAIHKSVAHFLSKCVTQILQIGCILFDAYRSL